MLNSSNKSLIFNFDNITKKDNNKDWPYRKLIIGPSGSCKTNYLLNSIQRDNNIIDKIYLYAKDLEEPKYKLLIHKREKAGINFNNDPNAFIEYSNSMDDILSGIEYYTKKRKRKVLIIFDDMISHVMSDKQAQQVVKALFIRCRKPRFIEFVQRNLLIFWLLILLKTINSLEILMRYNKLKYDCQRSVKNS